MASSDPATAEVATIQASIAIPQIDTDGNPAIGLAPESPVVAGDLTATGTDAMASPALPVPTAPPPPPEPAPSWRSSFGGAFSALSGLKDTVKEKGLLSTVKEKGIEIKAVAGDLTAAAADADWRSKASGLGRRLGSMLSGAEGPEDAAVDGESHAAVPADGVATEGDEEGHLSAARAAAGQALAKAREVAGSAANVASTSIHAVREDPRAAAVAVKERAAAVASVAVEKVSTAAANSETVAKVVGAAGSVVETSRSVASRTAGAVTDVTPSITAAAANTVRAARSHTPAVLATTGGAIGASIGAVGNTMGAAAGAAAGVAAATMAHARMRRAMKDAGVEGVEVLSLADALDANGIGSATAELEAAYARATADLHSARAALDEAGLVAAEGSAVYLHSAFDEACSAPAPPSHPPPLSRPRPPPLPPAAALAYAAAAEACVQHAEDASARLVPFRKRATALRAQIAAAATPSDDPSEKARKKQMAVYAAKAVVGGACTCISELAAGSVHALGAAGGLSVRAMVALEAELAERCRQHAAPFGRKDDEPLALSAGATSAALAGSSACACTCTCRPPSPVRRLAHAHAHAGPSACACTCTCRSVALREPEELCATRGAMGRAPPRAPPRSPTTRHSRRAGHLLHELNCYVGHVLETARAAHALANEVCAVLPMAELAAPLGSLQETLDAFEAGLAVDSSEVRARLGEALHYLIPLCALMQPPPDKGVAAADDPKATSEEIEQATSVAVPEADGAADAAVSMAAGAAQAAELAVAKAEAAAAAAAEAAGIPAAALAALAVEGEAAGVGEAVQVPLDDDEALLEAMVAEAEAEVAARAKADLQ